MPKNSSTFSFKRIPLSAILSVVIVIAAEFTVRAMVERGMLNDSKGDTIFSEMVETHKNEFHGDKIVVIGNSRSGGIDNRILCLSFFNWPIRFAVSLAAGGAMPITYGYMLDELEKDRLGEGDLFILCLTPMGFNKYNTCIRRTIKNYFSFSEFFSLLVTNFRLDDIAYFLTHRSLDLLRYRRQLNGKTKVHLFSLDSNAIVDRRQLVVEGKVFDEEIDRYGFEPKLGIRELEAFEKEYYREYTFDPMQFDAVQHLIDRWRSCESQVAIVLLPLSKRLRALLDVDIIPRFVEKLKAIAARNDVPLLDYLTSYTGDEYRYYDHSHLTISSRIEFTRKLGRDLYEKAKLHDYPILRHHRPKGARSLYVHPERLTAGVPGKLTFELNMGPECAGRKYLLLGSVSGTDPGVRLPGTPFTLPLNLDEVSSLILALHTSSHFTRFSGVLDTHGKGEASISIPGEITGDFGGKSLWFSFLLVSPIDFASNAVRIDFTG